MIFETKAASRMFETRSGLIADSTQQLHTISKDNDGFSTFTHDCATLATSLYVRDSGKCPSHAAE